MSHPQERTTKAGMDCQSYLASLAGTSVEESGCEVLYSTGYQVSRIEASQILSYTHTHLFSPSLASIASATFDRYAL